jgi:hypothetical protein
LYNFSLYHSLSPTVTTSPFLLVHVGYSAATPNASSSVNCSDCAASIFLTACITLFKSGSVIGSGATTGGIYSTQPSLAICSAVGLLIHTPFTRMVLHSLKTCLSFIVFVYIIFYY